MDNNWEFCRPSNEQERKICSLNCAPDTRKSHLTASFGSIFMRSADFYWVSHKKTVMSSRWKQLTEGGSVSQVHGKLPAACSAGGRGQRSCRRMCAKLARERNDPKWAASPRLRSHRLQTEKEALKQLGQPATAEPSRGSVLLEYFTQDSIKSVVLRKKFTSKLSLQSEILLHAWFAAIYLLSRRKN